ncbi:extensin-like domain-containing protein [Paracoccus salsus]|uniref:extensin-like domain-containing protein n=1 Tax=Paracoccus salsus TaxID=2911061 RepID=UPI001F1B5055|nr:extensin family protein [Paracoccus salsus]MCF3973410.1 extensin family protein [Paracoccus salsus]
MLRESDQDYAACRLSLALLGTAYQELPPITDQDNRDCGIARPIRVSQILPDLALDGDAVMRCDTARGLGFWARDFLRPAAATLSGAPRVTGMQLGTTYDCRGRIGSGAAEPVLSQHAHGTAIDIAAFRFQNGEVLPVAPRRDDGDRPEAFQRAVRSAACLFFTTVLGPGANAAHDDHLHLDLAARSRGWRLCQ